MHTTHPTAGPNIVPFEQVDPVAHGAGPERVGGDARPTPPAAGDTRRHEMEIDHSVLAYLREEIRLGSGQIERCAYAIWEAEGRPEGRQAEHWHEAETHLLAVMAEFYGLLRGDPELQS